jgi:hypothetical protein
MCKKGLLKRLVPFFLALGLGLFVASFFVTLALPNVRFTRKWRSHREYHRMMEFENQRLKQENYQLKREIRVQRIEQSPDFEGDINQLVPPVPPLAPVAPRSR